MLSHSEVGMSNVLRIGRRFLRDDAGAALVEYGMLVLLVALVAIAAVTSVGTKVKTIFESANTKLPTA